MSPASSVRVVLGLLCLIGPIGLVACVQPEKPRPRRPASSLPVGHARELLIAYQANLLGEIEPCG